MSNRALIALVTSVLIGVGATLIHSLNSPDTLTYHIKPSPSPTLIDLPPVPSVIPKNREHLKNKRLTQDRIYREIGETPRIQIYQTVPRTLSDQDLHCLTLNVYYEAKGESLIGMIAVAQVTLNRLDVNYRGQRTLCNIVYDTHQFSWTRSTKQHRKTPTGDSWGQAVLAAQKAVEGLRIAGLEDSLHYHADWIPHPSWSLKMLLNHVIGQHVYLRAFHS